MKVTRIFAVFLLASLAALQAAERRPNVVFILIDDFGYECVSANGGESYKTPVMDRLAVGGVRFEQCHVQPLCTPTRVALMTGLNNKRNYTHFAHMDASQKTFGNLFKDAGYATCIAGKWQLANGYEGPGRFGFDEYCLWQLVRRPGRYKNPGLEINGKQHDYTMNEYGPDIVSEYVLDFISRKKDQPFFLYYPMMLTHDPYDATPESPDYKESISGKNAKPLGHFPDMVAYCDKLIGKVIDRLDELHLRDNTLVVVLGDNGTGNGTPSKFKGRNVLGGKGKSTAWGTHVPCIGNWPGHFPGGKVCADLIDPTDFLPTFCQACAIPVPNEWKIDGRSFLPQLRGENGTPRDGLYAWYNPSGGATAKAEFAHDAKYKLYSDGRFYNVEKDDTEKSPLADATLEPAAQAAKAKLKAILEQHAGPRDDHYVKQSHPFGGEKGEDAEGNKIDAPAGAKAVSPRSAKFDERDTNHDGKVNVEEFIANQTDKDAAKGRFEKFDTNKDGFLSREEFINMGK